MMKATVRHGSLMVLIALLASLLAACGGGTAGQGGAATEAPATGGETAATTAPATGGETAATTAPATGGETGAAGTLPAECTDTITLDYWNPFTGPDGPFMGTLTDNFNAENPNIQVIMTSQAEYYTQLGTAAASNALPDVAIIHADQVATQAFRNVLRPIDDLVSQLGISGDDFPEAVWAAGEVNGQRYAIPLDIHPGVLYYNADLLEQAGISGPPTNQEEFDAAAQALTTGDTKGFLITSGFFSQMIFRTLLYQFGGTEFNEDGTEAVFNSEAGVRALQWMKDVQTKYGEPNLETDAEINGFKAGTAAMMMNGIWQITNVTGEAVEFNGQGTAVPQFGEQPAVGLARTNWPCRRSPTKTPAATRPRASSSSTWSTTRSSGPGRARSRPATACAKAPSSRPSSPRPRSLRRSRTPSSRPRCPASPTPRAP